MSKSQTLRALVNERLVAAADEIFALFERTILEYEEELRRPKEENNLLLLESFLSSRVPLKEEETPGQTPSPKPDLKVNKENLGNKIKDEPEEQHNVKQEEEQLPLSLPEASADCVKSEFSLLEQRPTDQKDETYTEDISSEPQCQPVTRDDTDNTSDSDKDFDWEPRSSFPFQQMETECTGDPYNIQVTNISTKQPTPKEFVPEMRVGNNSGSEKQSTDFEKHKILHSCRICMQTYTQKFRLQAHLRIAHGNEKPYSCSVCTKTFGRLDCLKNHERIHRGEKPFKCLICNRGFANPSNLNAHKRVHTGEKPYSCTICGKKYTQNNRLKSHMLTHTRTNERNYVCPFCDKGYAKKSSFDIHMRCHTGEKPYICPICSRPFSVSQNLTRHMKTHEEAIRISHQN